MYICFDPKSDTYWNCVSIIIRSLNIKIVAVSYLCCGHIYLICYALGTFRLSFIVFLDMYKKKLSWVLCNVLLTIFLNWNLSIFYCILPTWVESYLSSLDLGGVEQWEDSLKWKGNEICESGVNLLNSSLSKMAVHSSHIIRMLDVYMYV